MGSFVGHIIPGSFFFIVALWWTVQVIRRYYHGKTKSGPTFRSSVTLPPRSGRFRNTDLEGWVAVSMGAIGIFVEIVAACILRGRPIHMGNIQHATMYFFFGLLGLASVLGPVLRKYIPEFDNVRYLLLALSYVVEGLLFKFHLFGRDEMDVMLHTLLLYTIYVTVIVTLLEMAYPHNVLLPLSRAFFTLLQGTWFWQVAIILYNPLPGHEWSHKEMHELMIVVAIFAWHMAALLLLMALVSVLIRRFDSQARDVNLTDYPMSRSENGYAQLLEAEQDAET